MLLHCTLCDAPWRRLVVVLWADGFQVGEEGPFRATADSAENASFVADLEAGHVPRELESALMAAGAKRGETANVKVVDRRPKPFDKPSSASPSGPAVPAFSGTGHVAAAVTDRTGAVAGGGLGAAAALDESKPIVKIQVRLPSGAKAEVRLNADRTVADLQRAVVAQDPSLAAAGFRLLTGFPPKPLTDPTAPVAPLNNKAITVQKV